MKRNTLLVLLGAALLVLPTVMAGAGDEVMFAYSFEEGYKQAYKVKFSREIDAGFFTASMFADLSVTEKCVGVEEGKFNMEMVFDAVDASLSFGGNIQDAKISEALTGQSVFYTVDANGEVEDIKAATFIENFAQLSEQLITPVVESGYAYLPASAIALGGTWKPDEETETTDEGLEIATTGEFTFKEMKEEMGRHCAYVEGSMENLISGSTQSPQGSATADGKGEGKFKVFFDPKTGTIVKLKGSMDFNMELQPDAGGDAIQTLVGFTMEREIK